MVSSRRRRQFNPWWDLGMGQSPGPGWPSPRRRSSWPRPPNGDGALTPGRQLRTPGFADGLEPPQAPPGFRRRRIDDLVSHPGRGHRHPRPRSPSQTLGLRHQPHRAGHRCDGLGRGRRERRRSRAGGRSDLGRNRRAGLVDTTWAQASRRDRGAVHRRGRGRRRLHRRAASSSGPTTPRPPIVGQDLSFAAQETAAGARYRELGHEAAPSRSSPEMAPTSPA